MLFWIRDSNSVQSSCDFFDPFIIQSEIKKMSKGYWIGRVDVSNLDAYQNYITANASPFAKYGALFPVRGGSHEVVEGTSRQRNVVIEFESYQAALDCYH